MKGMPMCLTGDTSEICQQQARTSDVCECVPLTTLKWRGKKILPVQGGDSWKATPRCLLMCVCHDVLLTKI